MLFIQMSINLDCLQTTLISPYGNERHVQDQNESRSTLSGSTVLLLCLVINAFEVCRDFSVVGEATNIDCFETKMMLVITYKNFASDSTGPHCRRAQAAEMARGDLPCYDFVNCLRRPVVTSKCFHSLRKLSCVQFVYKKQKPAQAKKLAYADTST